MKKNRKSEMRRFSAGRKVEIVLRVLKGESLDEVSREIGQPASRISAWRDDFLRGGEASMKVREPNAQDEEIRILKETIGGLTVELEVTRQGIRKWKSGTPFVPGRWQS
ncbi:helix-turn-helix domain-containing protein [bacterium]|nr:helix-turn-helix domain-containing protein [bacterium]